MMKPCGVSHSDPWASRLIRLQASGSPVAMQLLSQMGDPAIDPLLAALKSEAR